MKTTSIVVIAGTLAALLAGCGERQQTAFASHRKDDAPAYTRAQAEVRPWALLGNIG